MPTTIAETTASTTSEGSRYLLITPCRNEEEYIGTTLATTCAQSILPSMWIIVDDGSTDRTPEIVSEYAKKFDFIKLVKRADRGERAVGPGVIEAFYDGLAHANLDEFDYVVKFDADLEMPPKYFERTIERMKDEPMLGNLSGKLFERRPDGTLFEERTGDENAVGPVKFYRVDCFRDIGGFVSEVAWDGIDGHICRMNNWLAASVEDEEMKIIHLRPMGSSQKGIVVGRVRWGRGKYFMGSAWYYVLASALYRSIEPPYLIGGVALFYGYLRALLTGHRRYDNPAYQRYIRDFERAQLLRGKSTALEIENQKVRDARNLQVDTLPINTLK